MEDFIQQIHICHNFKAPVSVETQYKEYSTKDYNFDFFKKKPVYGRLCNLPARA